MNDFAFNVLMSAAVIAVGMTAATAAMFAFVSAAK